MVNGKISESSAALKSFPHYKRLVVDGYFYIKSEMDLDKFIFIEKIESTETVETFPISKEDIFRMTIDNGLSSPDNLSTKLEDGSYTINTVGDLAFKDRLRAHTIMDSVISKTFSMSHRYLYAAADILTAFCLLKKQHLLIKDYPEFRDFCPEVIQNAILTKGAFNILSTIGLIETDEDVEPDFATEFINEHMPRIISDVILVGGVSMFTFNGKCYEYISPKEYMDMIYHYYRDMDVTVALDYNKVRYLLHFFQMELDKRSKVYDFHTDYSYTDKVAMSFINGTLYFYKDTSWEFCEGSWSIEDKCFMCISEPFHESMLHHRKLKNSLVNQWIEKRFKTKISQDYFKMSLADTFVTASNSENFMYIYGAAGIGKSTLFKALQNIINKFNNKRNVVGALDVEKWSGRFSKIALARTPINLTSEISDRNVDDSVFKSMISREKFYAEHKGFDGFEAMPIAKHIAIANSTPNMTITEGVLRRFGLIRVEPGRIREELSRDEFEKEFITDKFALVSIIIEGMTLLIKNKFDPMKFYMQHVGSIYHREMAVDVDSVACFLEDCCEFTDDDEDYISKDELVMAYNAWIESDEGSNNTKMKPQTLKKKFTVHADTFGYKVGRKTFEGKKISIYHRIKLIG